MRHSTLVWLAIGIAASGCGTDPEGDSPLTLSPTALDFGSTGVGTRSAALRVTVTNSGDGESGLLTVEIGGGSPGEYSLASDECTGHRLGAGASCRVDVTLLPASFGTREAVLAIVDARGQRVTASLRGSGSTLGTGFTLAPQNGNFGEARAGEPGQTKTFVVQNGFRSVTDLTSVTIEGAGAAAYRISNDLCTAANLAPSASCAIDVQFMPLVAGTFQATLLVSGGPETTRQAQLTGVSGTPGTITVSPAGSHAFGSVTVGTASSAASFIIENTGLTATGALTVGLSGANHSDFQVSYNDCYPTLAPRNVCQIDLRFVPTAAGARSASLTVTDAFGTAASIPMTGEGLPQPTPLTMTPSGSFSFAPTLVGATSFRSVTITNPGSGPSGPLSTQVAQCYTDWYYGDYCVPSPDFALSLDTCAGVDLPAGGSCTLQIEFRPSGLGSYTGKFEVSSSARFGVLSLDGTGAGLTPSTSELLFPSVAVGAASEPQHIVVTNSGTTNTGPIAVEISGFVFEIVSNDCSGVSLAAGASCIVSVRFRPTSPGPRQGSVGFAALPGGTRFVTLQATGL